MEYRYRRPGRRPDNRLRGRGARLLGLLAVLIGLVYLQSNLNLAIYSATTRLDRQAARVEELEDQVSGARFEIDRMADIARLGPRAEALGLRPPTPTAISYLPAVPGDDSRGARPLQGAGALGRLVSRLQTWTGARVATATAADPATGGRP